MASSSSMSVFINMPFDSQGKYRDLLVAYVAGLAGLGFMPRSILEIPPTQYRLARLHAIISACGSSVHDLSCVAATKGCPRFNMPFELGLVARTPKAKWFVFEEKQHRVMKTLSDINGHDAIIHGGKPRQLVAKLREIFQNSRRQPTVKELQNLLREVMTLAANIEQKGGSLLGRQSFKDLVVGARLIAKRRGLI
jgi:hypothetical protein